MPGDSGALALRISAPHQTHTTLNVNSSFVSESVIGVAASLLMNSARSIRRRRYDPVTPELSFD
jgi:hypothetical protein